MHVIALPGDYAPDHILQDDMGNPAWVDKFWPANGWDDRDGQVRDLVAYIGTFNRVVLLGYSRGGSIIAELSSLVPGKIAKAVVYESPVECQVRGNFPVLMIWNDYGVLEGRRRYDAISAMKSWTEGHPVSLLIGTGKHIRMVDRRIRHAWDVSLNTKIEEWVVR